MARTVIETYAFIRNGYREAWLDQVYVSTIGKQKFLASRGIESTFASVGSDLTFGKDRNLPRDSDVVFVGRSSGSSPIPTSPWRRLAVARTSSEAA